MIICKIDINLQAIDEVLCAEFIENTRDTKQHWNFITMAS